MSLQIKHIGDCSVAVLGLSYPMKTFKISMTLSVECTQCHVVKEVTGKPDSFLQPVVLACSQCQDVRRITEVTVGDIIYTAFENGEGYYTSEQLAAWKKIFASQTPFETLIEFSGLIYE